MRTQLLVLIVIALVAGALWWLGTADGDAAPPVHGGPAASGNQQPHEPAEIERSPAVPDVPKPPPDMRPEPPRDAAGNGSVAPAPKPPATVVANVRDLTTRAPVASFRWRFRNSLVTDSGEGTDGRAELALPASAFGELLIEADGYTPFTKNDVVAATPPAHATSLDVFLVPAVKAAGITLFVRDLALQPVQNVIVDAFALTPESRDTAWQLGKSTWSRTSASPSGRYVLPELAPGEYGIRVAATKEDGTLLPLLPWRRTFVLTGDNGFVEDVPLEPGALLVLELLDNTGAPFDQAQFGNVTLSMRLPGGPAVQRKWIVRTTDGGGAAAIDVLPGIGKCELADAVTPGQYVLDVFVRGEPRVQRQLLLRGGLAHEEKIVVP